MKRALTWLGIAILATPLAICIVFEVALCVSLWTGEPAVTALALMQRQDAHR